MPTIVQSARLAPPPTQAASAWRRWKQANREVFLARWWGHWRVGDGAFVLQAVCLVFMVSLELVLWPPASRRLLPSLPPERLLHLAVGAAPVVLLVVGSFNALGSTLVVRRLRRIARPPRAVALFCLVLLSTLPFFGLLTIPLWRYLESRFPHWLYREERSSALPVASRGRKDADILVRAGPGVRALSQSFAAMLGFYLANVLSMGVAALALYSTAPNRTWGFGLSLALFPHGLALATALLARVEPETIAPRLRQRDGLEVFWLFPLPISAAWFLVSRLGALEHRRQSTLSHDAFLGRSALIAAPAGTRVAAWLSLARLKAPPWRRIFVSQESRSTTDLPDAEKRFLAVARLKTAALLLDGFALATILAALGVMEASPNAPATGWLLAVLLTAGATLALTVLLRALTWLALRVGSNGWLASLDHLPFLRLVAFGQICLAGGFLVGFGVASEDRGLLASTTALVASLGAVVTALALFLNLFRPGSRGRRDRADQWFWPLFFLASPFLVLVFFRAGALAHPASVATGAALAAFTLGLTVAWRGRSALAHPLTPEAMRDVRLPSRIRGHFLLLSISAALPLGGLLTPLWLALRERHRHALDELAACLSSPERPDREEPTAS